MGTGVNSRLFTFAGGRSGSWRILSMRAIVGDKLAEAERLDIVSGTAPMPEGTIWSLGGLTSNDIKPFSFGKLVSDDRTHAQTPP